ncbi:hypothetical protein GOODEAATRI_026072 [Goodea atripinnis]|uniref:Uncharacterized protein n=1 Tax=Goodea atripinnis TaxID=208336 RepID=A0ABV0Q1W4_9TELE
MLFTHGLKSSGKQWTMSSMFYSTSRNDGVCFSILYESLNFSIQIYISIHPASPQLSFLPPSVPLALVHLSLITHPHTNPSLLFISPLIHPPIHSFIHSSVPTFM